MSFLLAIPDLCFPLPIDEYSTSYDTTNNPALARARRTAMSSIDLSVYFVRLFSILAAIRAAYAAIEMAENVRDALRRGLKVMVDANEVYAAAKAAYDTIPAFRTEVAQGIEFLKANCSWLDDSIESCRQAKEDSTKAAARSRLGKLWEGACSSAANIRYREAGEIIKTLD